MNFWNRKIGPFKLWWFIATWVVLAVLIIIGSFADLGLSKAVVDPNNFIGKVGESFGYLLGFTALPAVGAMLVVANCKSENPWWVKALSIAGAVICITIAGYFSASDCAGEAGYSWKLPSFVGYIIAFVFQIGAFVGYCFLIDKTITSKELNLKALAMFLGLAACMFLLHIVLKKLAYRPRYRGMVYDNEINGTKAVSPSLAYFQNWWDFNWFKKPVWWETQITLGNITEDASDIVKSWPSGHTNTASLAVSLPIFFSVSTLRDKKNINAIVYGVACAYTALVAWTRIRIGAHFLTDVAWGMLVTALMVPLAYFITGLFFKNPTLEDREGAKQLVEETVTE